MDNEKREWYVLQCSKRVMVQSMLALQLKIAILHTCQHLGLLNLIVCDSDVHHLQAE